MCYVKNRIRLAMLLIEAQRAPGFAPQACMLFRVGHARNNHFVKGTQRDLHSDIQIGGQPQRLKRFFHQNGGFPICNEVPRIGGLWLPPTTCWVIRPFSKLRLITCRKT